MLDVITDVQTFMSFNVEASEGFFEHHRIGFGFWEVL
jgi:hypothetical protein